MKRKRRNLAWVLWLAAITLVAVFFCVAAPALPVAPTTPLAGATVRVFHDAGHGSGVHIGHGLILTAAHVVKDHADGIKIKTDAGVETTAEVLWASAEHDVALLRDADLSAASARLDCRATKVGEHVSAVGNPGPLEFVTTWGRVAAIEKARANWKSTIMIDSTVAPGMSGGPLFDRYGHVIGIVVGVQISGSSPFGINIVPISYIVPSTDVCRLLAR